ncbi:MAG: type II toxin-antitoxin system VapB family antitoxin [Chitinophagaceae bacterium]|nr:MAG: type II toxin-antitoxin system VapB family antitoxin [Chitinophagaceae bacterium]
MHTNIEIDEKLIREAMKISRLSTKRETVELALKELIAAAKRKRFLQLKGKVKWDTNLDKLRQV